MLENIQDDKLLTDCKLEVQRERQSTAKVLEYLAEIDSRRLWLKEGYSSLYDFCILYLGYSEGETYRRIQACRLSSKIAETKPLLESNQISLSTMSLLSPHLTKENAKEILPQVINQPTREVEKIIESHFPESKKKIETLKIEIDNELKELLEQAKLIASEKEPGELLKKVLKTYLREKRPRNVSQIRHTRYVPQPIAREVRKRANYQCEYRSKKGIRCNQKAHLQNDHIRPWALGGSSHDKDNLQILCRAHNLYKAKCDFPGKSHSLGYRGGPYQTLAKPSKQSENPPFT